VLYGGPLVYDLVRIELLQTEKKLPLQSFIGGTN